ncbi:putative bifunctional diguanylate cyclase/phosphodiesterase [Derxia lacustris]|uniref:putative bifunctional diguanylate cyclase/phosphodiesterase n=1 Tax=Derxia lacustris TaxID=764842 RepID=UPI000A175094|nr:EAL domain-containing protein [Derxia lacustris]
MHGSYHPLLVLLSLIVATGAAYTALLLAGRLSDARPRRQAFWLAGGATTLGTGIWSMHFIGMLAFELPIPVGYDLGLTALSWALAVAASALALGLTLRDRLTPLRGALGALVIGGGIGAMHYIGMAALQMQPAIHYRPGLFALSVGIAVAASGAAVVILRWLQQRRAGSRAAPLAGAMALGLAITGMHYTAMAAAEFAPGAVCGALGSLSADNLLATVLTGVIGMLGLGATVAELDAHSRNRAEAHARSLARASSQLRRMAVHDALTGLPNRRRLLRRLTAAAERARRDGGRVGLLVLGLDGFKAINDALGHAGGDELLRRVAGELAECRPAGSKLARLGGDEFALLYPQPPALADVTALADRLIAQVNLPRNIAGHEIRISASVGIALLPDHAADARQLLVHADAALRAAKHADRSRHCVFDPSIALATGDTLRTHAELIGALGRGELELFLQPKVTACGARPAGAEALLRWRHPRRGVLAPGEFLPIAERFGLMNPIGDWVIDAGCALAARLAQAGRPCRIAINLSPVQFKQPDLVQRLGAALLRHGIGGAQLLIEITESSAIENPAGFVERLAELRALGLDVALDDFGTGYSSLSYLRLVRARQLKLDRSFVHDIAQSGESRIIVGAILQLAHAIGMTTVAEGVEDEAQARLLEQLGCDELQGYLYSRPLPEAEFLRWLDRQHERLAAGLPTLQLRPTRADEADAMVALNAQSARSAQPRAG